MRVAEIGAGVFAPVAPEDFYLAVLDVRGFPAWAPGVRRAGMRSEWEVSFLGFGRKVASVLGVAEAPSRLRWIYAGPVAGWGECSIAGVVGGTLAEFRTAFRPSDPLLASLMRGDVVRAAARVHLERSLVRLERRACDGGRVSVGPLRAAG